MDENKKRNKKLRLFGLWSTSTHQSILLATSLLNDLIVHQILFIVKESKRYTSFLVFLLTTINLIYTNHLVILVSWVLITLVSIRPRKPNGRSRTLRFDLEQQMSKKKEAIIAWIRTSAAMTGTLTSAIMAGIGYYGQDLDNWWLFGWHQLQWPELSQLWALNRPYGPNVTYASLGIFILNRFLSLSLSFFVLFFLNAEKTNLLPNNHKDAHNCPTLFE
jgi:hypothetical protein